MKRRLVFLCWAALFTLVFGVFSVSASGSTEGTAGGTAQPKTVKLLVWDHTPQFEAPLEATLKNFMSKNPNIVVSYEIKTPEQYYSLLQTAIQAGEAPDLYWTNGTATEHLGNFIKQGAVMDLTGKLDVSAYPKLAKAMVTIDGKVYAVPGATIGTRAVYYNKDIFAKQGLSEPKTFADFENILATLKAKSGVIPMSLGGRFSWSLLFHFEPILAALHPDWISDAEQGKATPNDPRVVDALTTM
ncbi:MAG TPA: extracellular solute-binding protein, partial [Spirochaetia bacterium]|nr:extracellular solute-binding protein [Spirochaetia bacterium]